MASCDSSIRAHHLPVIYSLSVPSADPPEVSTNTPIVYSGEGQEASLTCNVHGETQPEVIT
jgi:hypothetical protein